MCIRDSLYTAGPIGGVQDEVRAVDTAGNTASATIDVGPAITLTALSTSVMSGEHVVFSLSGGSGTYVAATFAPNESGASISASYVYTAGSKTGLDTIVVTDSIGSSAKVTITVSAGLPAETASTTITSPSADPESAPIRGTESSCSSAPVSCRPSGGAALSALALGILLAVRRRKRTR